MTKKRKRRVNQRKQTTPISPVMLVSIAVAAVLIVVGLVMLGNRQERNLSAPVDVSQFPAIGPADAPVTVIEYSDFGCPHCRSFVLESAELLVEEFVNTDQIRYVAHPFALNPETALATEAAWCAADQGKYFEYQRTLYENFGMPFNEGSLIAVGEGLELDQSTFSQCVSGRDHQFDVENARRAAVSQGINSTPTFFINNRRVEGNQPYAQFQSIINQELAAQ